MGILSGTVRFRRYQVRGEIPAGFHDEFEDAIRKAGFQDFAADDEREQVAGWAPVDDWFSPDLPRDRWLVENRICLTLRIDTKRLPAQYLRYQCRQLEAEWRLKSGRENLSRAEREEVLAIVRRQLLQRAIPAVQGIDLCWDLERGEVWFWSTGETVNESFRSLFEKTFRVKLRPLFPYALALRQQGDDGAEVLDRVVPSVLRGEVRA
jgi:DNA recombination-dependent growth factor C